jgi:hypothetical protein
MGASASKRGFSQTSDAMQTALKTNWTPIFMKYDNNTGKIQYASIVGGSIVDSTSIGSLEGKYKTAGMNEVKMAQQATPKTSGNPFKNAQQATPSSSGNPFKNAQQATPSSRLNTQRVAISSRNTSQRVANQQKRFIGAVGQKLYNGAKAIGSTLYRGAKATPAAIRGAAGVTYNAARGAAGVTYNAAGRMKKKTESAIESGAKQISNGIEYLRPKARPKAEPSNVNTPKNRGFFGWFKGENKTKVNSANKKMANQHAENQDELEGEVIYKKPSPAGAAAATFQTEMAKRRSPVLLQPPQPPQEATNNNGKPVPVLNTSKYGFRHGGGTRKKHRKV